MCHNLLPEWGKHIRHLLAYQVLGVMLGLRGSAPSAPAPSRWGLAAPRLPGGAEGRMWPPSRAEPGRKGSHEGTQEPKSLFPAPGCP